VKAAQRCAIGKPLSADGRRCTGVHIIDYVFPEPLHIPGWLPNIVQFSGTGLMNGYTERIDAVLTHRFWGFPIFLAVIFFVFYFTFVIGKYPVHWIEVFFDFLKQASLSHMDDGPFRDLLVDGIITGVGGVAVYLPNILLLFLFIAFMDDSGYTARTALITDKWMSMAGLPGRSFIPLLMGFGCNVPAIMTAGMIDNKRERILTILIIPFMSCSARLPVYILFISAFFSRYQGVILFSIYLFGIIIGWLTAVVFSKTFLKKTELPADTFLQPYCLPALHTIIRQMWNKTWYFIKKMGGVILVASLVIWALGYFPSGPERLTVPALITNDQHSTGAMIPDLPDSPGILMMSSDNAETEIKMHDRIRETAGLENSYIARIGKWIHPLFSPLGFDWKMSVSILTGFPAKEIVISTLAVLYSSEDMVSMPDEINRSLSQMPGSAHPALTAISFMIFILLSFPCIGTLMAIRREAGRWAWMILSFSYTTCIAWIISFIIFQAGNLILG
jgi:ferrous iron transport protein B